MHSPIPVAPQGWSITSYLTLGLNILFGTGMLGALGVWLKSRPETLKTNRTAEEKLRDDLIQRVERLEQRLEEERTQHEAAMALMRHRLNNSDQSIEALLLILDDDDLPERMKAKIGRIRETRARQKEAEERERDTMRAAGISAKVITTVLPG